jgi:Xaa-Pro aminopeptidase
MEKNGLDALIASSGTNMHYLTDIPGLVGYAVLPKEKNFEPFLIACVIYVDRLITGNTWFKDIRLRGPAYYFEEQPNANIENIEKKMKKLIDEAEMDVIVASVNTERSPAMMNELVKGLEERGLSNGNLGIEEAGTSIFHYEKLQKVLPYAKLQFADKAFGYARQVKTQDEIERIKECSSIIDDGFIAISESVKPGISEGELSKIFKKTVVNHEYTGAGVNYSGCHVTFGRRTILASSWTGSDGIHRLEKGDIIRVGGHINWRNHPCHHQRTMVLGEPKDSRVKKYWKGIIDADNAGLTILRPGIKASEVYKTMIKEARKSIPHYRRHHMGHALSLGGGYDSPNFMADDDTELEKNMVFNIEPSLYLELGFGGFSLEDTLRITEKDSELFTKTPRDMWYL